MSMVRIGPLLGNGSNNNYSNMQFIIAVCPIPILLEYTDGEVRYWDLKNIIGLPPCCRHVAIWLPKIVMVWINLWSGPDLDQFIFRPIQ